MFDETLSSRVARLEEAYQAARDAFDGASGYDSIQKVDDLRDTVNVRKLALLKVEQALLVAGF